MAPNLPTVDIVISGPPGAGKTHLADARVLMGPTLGFAVTVRDNGLGEDDEVTAHTNATDVTRARLNILVKRSEQ